MKNFHSESVEKLFEALLLLENTEECGNFFDDICTVKEIQDIAQRLEVAKMLKAKKSYQTISKETGASTATISRVNRCLLYGSGGYTKMLEKLEEAE
ncbi:MAG: TrpR YerC/YecD [Clostridia bacterium]|nr:TrpR YerC/YecD [Clostridia bacterium]